MVDEDESALVNLILAGWEGIEEESGKPVPYRKELKEFVDDPYWIKAVINAYVSTYNEAELGN